MELTKLPSLSILITLSFQSLLILGETFLAPEANKDSEELKVTEKRTNNFRVPMEMPYDPNFWPARGRRSRRDQEKTGQTDDDCITDEMIRCQNAAKIHEEKSLERKILPLDFELMPAVHYVDDMLAGFERTENCFNRDPVSCLVDHPKGRVQMKLPEILEEHYVGLKRFDETLHKKQKHFLQPQLIFYGNGVYWAPENLFGTKKKKQDVFWVARGKKNFNLKYL